MQPIVENAIKHAFNESIEKKSITIITDQENRDVVVKVIDSGSGIEEEELTRIKIRLNTPERENELLADHEKQAGIGLINVHYRLQMWFGREYGITLTSSEGAGTVVEIRIPTDYIATDTLK